MSVWESFEVERKITDILRETPYQEEHHFGRPYLSAYQLAIAVDHSRVHTRALPEVRRIAVAAIGAISAIGALRVFA